MNGKEKNAARFTGFANVYDRARPRVPEYPVKIICRYLGKAPETVIDLGCGTGLSSLAWRDAASRIIGVDPSADMLAVARTKSCGNAEFVQAYSDSLPLGDGCADAVVASQSFHWMEPDSTLREVNRILRDGGVFATVDCDWPPATIWKAEMAYMKLYDKVRKLENDRADLSDTFVRYEKKNHLENIRKSGFFRYTRELLFSNTENCTAERFIGIIMSQGSLQTVLKTDPSAIEEDIRGFCGEISRLFADKTFDIDFSYRMRIGIK